MRRSCNSIIALSAFALPTSCASPPRPTSPQAPSISHTTFLPELHPDPAAQVLFQDGALPTPIPRGTLWTFGDTFTGSRAADNKPNYTGCLFSTMAFLPNNEKAWPPRLQYLRGPDNLAASPLSLTETEDPKTRRLWPLAGVWLPDQSDESSGIAYMFYGLIDITGPGPWGFKSVGTGLAKATTPLGHYNRLHNESGARDLWPMGPSSIIQRDTHLYLYAPRRFKGEEDLSSGLLIGRVTPENIEEPRHYTFFAGLTDNQPTWTPKVEDALPAAPDVWGQASVAWNAHLNSYVLATSANIFEHDQIRLRQSETPWGPWQPIGSITVPEREGEVTQLIYCTMLHPERDEDNGRIMTLTFCRMLKRDWAFTSPEAVKVELSP
jgi:hypothetical protein